MFLYITSLSMRSLISLHFSCTFEKGVKGVGDAFDGTPLICPNSSKSSRSIIVYIEAPQFLRFLLHFDFPIWFHQINFKKLHVFQRGDEGRCSYIDYYYRTCHFLSNGQVFPLCCGFIYNISIMSMKWVVALLFCCCLVMTQTTITVFTSTSPTLATQISAMSANCSAAPVSRLSLCNSTCLTCQATDPSKCQTCGTGYVLSAGNCRVDTNLYNYTYNNYVGGSDLGTDITSLSAFKFVQSNEKLNIISMCSVCKSGTYEFFTTGLFKSTDIISLTYTRTDPIDQIQLKFNFASVVQSMKLFITLDDNQIYSKNFTGFSDLVGVFAQSSNTTSRSFLTLDALNKDSVSSIWVPVDTGLISYIVTNLTLKFYVQTNSTQSFTWGFNDMAVLMRDCQTCVSQNVKDLSASTIKAIGFTLLIVVILVIVLFAAIAFEEYKRKKDFQQGLGVTSSESNLPMKAINRVIQSIAAIRKARQKDWISEDKKFQLAKKRLESKRPKTMAL